MLHVAAVNGVLASLFQWRAGYLSGSAIWSNGGVCGIVSLQANTLRLSNEHKSIRLNVVPCQVQEFNAIQSLTSTMHTVALIITAGPAESETPAHHSK